MNLASQDLALKLQKSPKFQELFRNVESDAVAKILDFVLIVAMVFPKCCHGFSTINL